MFASFGWTHNIGCSYYNALQYTLMAFTANHAIDLFKVPVIFNSETYFFPFELEQYSFGYPLLFYDEIRSILQV